jgi:hypothetical protein
MSSDRLRRIERALVRRANRRWHRLVWRALLWLF